MHSSGHPLPLDFTCRGTVVPPERMPAREALAILAAQVRMDFPDSAYLSPVVDAPAHFCINLRRFVSLSGCTRLVIDADKPQFARCLPCAQGKRLAAESPFKPRPRTAPLPRPDLPEQDPRLADLASTLRQLTADGRVRVSLLDVMEGLGVRQYDEAMRLVRRAGLTSGRPFGSVPAIAVDHSLRNFIQRAEVPA